MLKVKTWNINAVIIYRFIVLCIIYFICRLLFLLFHFDSFYPVSFLSLLKIFWGGLRFDLAGLIYLNLPYIVLIILPFKFRHHSIYQKALSILFIVTNAIGIAANIIDIGYYPFTKTRLTASVFDQFSNEGNLPNLFKQFLIDYWYLFLIFVFLVYILIFAVKLVRVSKPLISNKYKYFSYSFLSMSLYMLFAVYLVRGNFQSGAKPLYLNDAARYSSSPSHLPLILSTPFSVIRTINKKSFEKKNFFTDDKELEHWMNPCHLADSTTVFQPKNIVIIILESFGREYIGAINNITGKDNFKSYTPFLDSLFQHGLLFKNAFANGRKSIDAPPAIFASIPSLTMPYTLTQNANNQIKTLIHCLKEKGYNTSFFHGADNGTMRFDAFCKLAGFDKYYGRTEYNNDKDFDGMWGIWDEEYLQYFANTLSTLKEPFLSSVFTLSSHHPFSIPNKYKHKFQKGDLPIHRCISYSDFALKRFFEIAKKQKWYHNTLFILTADHAALPYYSEYKTPAGDFAIPLFFYTPDDSLKCINTTTFAQQLDIMPTIFDLLNYDKPFFAFGKSLINTPDSLNFTFSSNKNRFQIIHDGIMLVKELDKEMQWQDITNGFENNEINPSDSIKTPIQNYAKAFEQQYFNRVIDNEMTYSQH